MDTNDRGTAGNETSSPVEISPLMDVTEAADSAGVGLPTYFTEAAWKRSILGGQDDFPGRCAWVAFDMLKALAVAVQFRIVAYEPEPAEFRWEAPSGCEYFGEDPGEEVPLKAVMRPNEKGVVSLVVMLQEEE